jgi:hypothetical protein
VDGHQTLGCTVHFDPKHPDAPTTPSITSNSHFDQACFAAVVGADGLAWVVTGRFSADVCGGVSFLAWPGFGGGVLFIA